MTRKEACSWAMPDDPEDGYLTPDQQAAYRRMLDRLSEPLDTPSIFEIMVDEDTTERGRHGITVPRET